ncbi:MAG: hypothetical protein AAFW75_25050 [Cyanobacteria bacterium J06636_16]
MKNSAYTHINLLVLAVLIAANCSACVDLKGSALPPTTTANVETSTTPNVDPSQLLEQALDVATTAEDPDAVLAKIATRLAEAGQYDQALTVIDTIEATDIKSSSQSQIGVLLAEGRF